MTIPFVSHFARQRQALMTLAAVGEKYADLYRHCACRRQAFGDCWSEAKQSQPLVVVQDRFSRLNRDRDDVFVVTNPFVSHFARRRQALMSLAAVGRRYD